MKRKPSFAVCSTFLICLLVSVSLPAMAANIGEVEKQIHLHEDECDIVVSFDGKRPVPLDTILPWLRNAAHAVRTYFHRFPVKTLAILITIVPGNEVGYSTADEQDGQPIIHIRVGEHVTRDDLKDDWVATHEMVHLSFPLVEHAEDWVAEGMASYVEPIARLQGGTLSAREYWREFVEKLPRGLPQKGDGGLSSAYPIKNADSIRRLYWGGALFFFMADLQIRSESKNKKGLQDAFAAILNAGGNIESDWDALKAFRIGDRAVNSDVLEKMYKKWGATPVSVNLDDIWSKLGIHVQSEQISFDDCAPLAQTRLAIEAGRPGAKQ
jgi:hypothetical protein